MTTSPLVHIREQSPGTLHVLTLTPFYPHAADDASGCFVAEPLAWLERIGLRSSVFAAQPVYRGKTGESASPATWVQYLALPTNLGLSTAGAFLFARLAGAVRRLHAEAPIDLIHAHAPLPCGHAAALLARELHIPFVVTVHGLDAFSTRQVAGFAGRWCQRVSRFVYRAARRVVCISEHVRQQVDAGAEVGVRTSVVYNGVDPEVFYPAETSPGDPVILSVGNLIPTKGHGLLLRALADLHPKYPGISCEIIGDGPERSRLVALAAELKISHMVRFLGRRSRREVAEAMRRCTVFALPSSYEGLGCVYLEAMAAGKPALGCRGQGIEEVIQHGRSGWLVTAGSQQELDQGLDSLLSDRELRERLGHAGRQTILQALTLQHQAQQLQRIYRECMG
jgi:glycosyltransferase involved in cell wall biosynthesis